MLILTSEITEGATGIVHGATLKTERTLVPYDVVVKLSVLDEQKDRLYNKHAIYETLKSKGIKGIPTVLGIFDDIEEGASMLLMTHAGAPLHCDHVLLSSQRYVVPFRFLIRNLWSTDFVMIELPS